MIYILNFINTCVPLNFSTAEHRGREMTVSLVVVVVVFMDFLVNISVTKRVIGHQFNRAKKIMTNSY